MPGEGYSSEGGSSRGSTPSPTNSKSYLQPLSISKEPQKKPSRSTQYDDHYLSPQYSTLTAPRYPASSSTGSSSKSHGSRKSGLKPLPIDYPKEREPTDRSDKTADSRYYPQSFLDRSRDDSRKHNSESRKYQDPRYYPNSSYYRD